MALGAGARVNKYRINFSIPASVSTKSDLSAADILCKAASFPSVSIGQIEVFNQGRKLVLPGDTTYTNTWALTFYQTEDHGLRKDLLAWMHAIDDFQRNRHSGNPNAVMGEMSVEQLDSAGNATAKYTFHNVFIMECGEVALTEEQDSGIAEFEATFSFTDWVVGDEEINKPSAGNDATKNDTSLDA